MVETIIGILITVAICAVVGWLVEKLITTVPAKFAEWTWIIKAVTYVILIAWVLNKYGIYTVPKPQ